MTSRDASRAPNLPSEDRDVTESGLLPAFQSTSEDAPPRGSSHGQPFGTGLPQANKRQAQRQSPPSIITQTGVAQLPPVDESEHAERTKEKPVTWSSLPRKDQLIILTLARLSEPLTQTSLQAYMFYQLKSFDPSLPDSTIASQAGILQGAFTATQCVTAIAWGRIADAEWAGRKKVILIGLLGTTISALGFGLSKSFVTAVVFRCLGGVLNGNIGVMRSMISEIIKEKRYQSRAFLLLPMTFNIGVIIGPVLGGLLADPVASYPSLFGPGSLFGGKDGVGWMIKWPYALPNLVSAIFLFCSSMAIIFGLEETHEALRDEPDFGIRLRRWISRNVLRRQRRRQGDYMPVSTDDRPHTPDEQPTDIEMATTPLTPTTPTSSSNSSSHAAPKKPAAPRQRQKLPFRRIWTRTVITTLLSHGILALHLGALNGLWFTFLSTPRSDAAHPTPPTHAARRLSVHFTGGLGLAPSRIGAALALLGAIGITLQLLVYPRVSGALGTTRSFRLSLLLFPAAYAAIPFLAVIPGGSALVWPAIAAVLAVAVAGRTFALPAAAILVNNACPHPSLLGSVHGVGQAVSSAARTLGPVGGGWVFGWGLRVGVVGLAWWGLAVIATCGVVAGMFVREGGGGQERGLAEEDGEEKDEEEEESGRRGGEVESEERRTA